MTAIVKSVRPGEYGDRMLADPDKYIADALAEAHDSIERSARETVRTILAAEAQRAGSDAGLRRGWLSRRRPV